MSQLRCVFFHRRFALFVERVFAFLFHIFTPDTLSFDFRAATACFQYFVFSYRGMIDDRFSKTYQPYIIDGHFEAFHLYCSPLIERYQLFSSLHYKYYRRRHYRQPHTVSQPRFFQLT